jgi:hypothetical protein
MKQKDMYTVQELFTSLPITNVELSKLTGKSIGTLARIKDGYPARRSTINNLLMIMSDIYKIDLSMDNVTGIILEERQAEKRAPRIDEKPPVSASVVKHTQDTDNPSKRPYNRKEEPIPDDLPAGTLRHYEFARQWGIKTRTFEDWIKLRHFSVTTRPKATRPKETEKFLTPDQQHEAMFWMRDHKPHLFAEKDEEEGECKQDSLGF